jgi:hypothetical protein
MLLPRTSFKHFPKNLLAFLAFKDFERFLTSSDPDGSEINDMHIEHVHAEDYGPE